MVAFKLIRALVFSAIFLIPVRVYSQIPTTDLANVVQQLLTYIEQLEQGLNQLEQLKSQGESVVKQTENLQALTGAKNISDLLNSPLLKEVRRSIPSDTMSVIENLSKGKLPKTQEDFKEVLGAIYDIYPALDKSFEYTPSKSKKKLEELVNRKSSIDVVSAGSVYTAIKSTDKSLNTIEGLIAEIDKTKDLKASVDLNSRLVAEVAIQMNMLTKLISASQVDSVEKNLMSNEINAVLKSRLDVTKNRAK